jgi:lysophospholipase L1-like esterase
VKWRYLPFSALVFILSLEILLRLVSWGLSLKHFSFMLPDSETRIVTLGESTSTDNFENVLTWPRQLEKILAERGLKTRVVNLSKPGTNSFYLVQKLKTQIISLRPAVVIAMMGVNDAVSIKMQESFWLRNFYIARYYKWYLYLNGDTQDLTNESTKTAVNPSETNFASKAEGNQEALELKVSNYLAALEEVPVAETEMSAKSLEASDPKNFSYILYRSVNRLFANMNLQQYRKFMILNEFLLSRGLFDENIVYYRLYSDWTERNIKGCTEFTETMWARYTYQFSERHLSMIANCISKANEAQKATFAKVLQSQELGFAFDSEKPASTALTANSYRELYELSVAHNFKLVIMQYPLEPIEKLKTSFTPEEAEKIIFVSNFENFSERLQTQKFEELFLDRFAKTFGHPSEAGHSIIAENAARVVLPLLKPE